MAARTGFHTFPGAHPLDAGGTPPAVCQSVPKGQAAIGEAYRAMVDRTGNLPSLPGIFPDQLQPVHNCTPCSISPKQPG